MMGISNNLIPTEPLGMDFFLYLPFYSPPPSFLAWTKWLRTISTLDGHIYKTEPKPLGLSKSNISV